MAVEKFKTSVFNAIKIDNVIWIDDRFSADNDSIIEDYLTDVESVHNDEPELITDFHYFIDRGIDVSHPFEVWKEMIPREDEIITEYYKHTGRDKPDFTTTEFNELISIFETNSNGEVKRLSLQEWNQTKDDWLSTNQKNLFLIDYNFEHEGQSKDFGKTIVKEILNQKQKLTDVYCVLFTSEAKHGQEEENKRDEIIKELEYGTDCHNFSVLSKDIITIENLDEDVCINFKASEFIKRIFLRKLSAEMVASISDKLIHSIHELKNDLSQHSIYEVDHSIFEGSLKEGASEIDLLHRLFSIKQHQSIAKFVKESQYIVEKLTDFRSVQAVIFEEAKYKKYLNKIIPVNNQFANLRKEEILDYSVNNMHSPLNPGDIFIFNDSRKYILIEQACDLTIRGKTGTRKLNEVILVPFTEREIKNNNTKDKASFYQKASEPKHHMLKVPNAQINNYYYLFDFSNAINVNVNWLDLCVFNKHGLLNIRYEEQPSRLIFLPGWIKKHNDLMEKLIPFKQPAQHYSTFSINKMAHKGDYTALKNEFSTFSLCNLSWLDYSVTPMALEFKGKRECRLRDTFTKNLIHDYYVGYKARTALETDYSR